MDAEIVVNTSSSRDKPLHELRTSIHITSIHGMDLPIRASLLDVARAAGVSIATVDRVLHGRSGVRARTVERVNAAIDQLGYRPDPAAARLARNRSARIVFVLPGTNSFITLLSQQLQALAPWLAEQRSWRACRRWTCSRPRPWRSSSPHCRAVATPSS